MKPRKRYKVVVPHCGTSTTLELTKVEVRRLWKYVIKALVEATEDELERQLKHGHDKDTKCAARRDT